MEMQNIDYRSNGQINQDVNGGHKGYFGFKGRAFPLLGFIVGLGSIQWTYQVAVTKNPPDIKKFPWTDITHTGIHYPQYVIFRIGMIVCPVILAITFQILKNFLQVKSFELKGQSEPRLKKFGNLSLLAALMLCISTSTISDGGDMNWTLHTIGATSFFAISIYLIIVASSIYRELYRIKPFINRWSFLLKKYVNQIALALLGIQILMWTKVIDWGSIIQWAAAFYIMTFFLGLYFDFKGLDIMLVRK